MKTAPFAKRILLVLLLLAVGILLWLLHLPVRTAIRASDTVVVSSYEIIGLQSTTEPYSVTLTAEDPLYAELSNLLETVLWLPSPKQGGISLGSRSAEFSILYGSAQTDELHLRITVTDSGHCQINGQNVIALSAHGSGKKLYQLLSDSIQQKAAAAPTGTAAAFSSITF